MTVPVVSQGNRLRPQPSNEATETEDGEDGNEAQGSFHLLIVSPSKTFRRDSRKGIHLPYMRSIYKAQHRKGMTMRNKIITVVLALTLAIAAGVLGYLSTADHPAGAATIPDRSTILGPGVEISPATVAPPVFEAPKQTTTTVKSQVTTSTTKAPTVTATTDTTTPNMPPERSETLSSRVPSSDAEIRFCEQINKPIGECRLPESEGMSEETTDATDYVEDSSARF